MHEELNRALASSSLPAGTALGPSGFAAARTRSGALFLRKGAEKGPLSAFAQVCSARGMGPDTSLRFMEELLKANLPWKLPEPCRISMDAEGRVWLSRTFTQQEQEAPDFASQMDQFLAIVSEHLSKMRAAAEAARRDNPFDGTGGLYS